MTRKGRAGNEGERVLLTDSRSGILEIQGFVIGENRKRELERVDVQRSIGRDEFRKLLVYPYAMKVLGLHRLKVVDVDFVDLNGDRHVKMTWTEPADSCEAETIMELMH